MTISASALHPAIIAAILLTLREEVTMARTINTEFSVEAAKPGDTVTIPVPPIQTTYDVTPAITPPALATTTVTTVPILLNRFKGSSFDMSSKDVAELADPEAIRQSSLAECIRGMVQEMNGYLLSTLYKDVAWHTGTAGTTPYASAVDATVDGRARLNRGLAPDALRTACLDYAAEANALKLAAFSDAAKRGDQQAILLGELAVLYGVRHLRDGQVFQHTAGTASAATVTVGTSGFTVPAGVIHAAITIPMLVSAATATLVAGDVGYVTVAGIRYEFVVVTGITLTTSSQPVACAMCGNPTAVVVAATTGITIAASHRANLMYQRNAFGLAVRTLPLLASEAGRAQIITDKVTGLGMKLLNLGGYHAEKLEVSWVYGASTVRANMAARILG